MTSAEDIELLKELFPKETNDIIKEGFKEGFKKGFNESMYIKSVEIAKKLKGMLDSESISKCTGLSIEEIEKL